MIQTQAREVAGQPKISPVSLTEAKRWLRIVDADTSEDDTINALLLSALDYAETLLNKCVSITPFVWEFSDFEDVVFTKYPYHSFVKVDYLNEEGTITTLSADNYEVSQLSSEDASLIFLNYPEATFSRADGSKKSNTVSIYFRCGYDSSSCPASIKMAIRLLVCRWFDNRQDDKKDKITAVESLLAPLRNVNF